MDNPLTENDLIVQVFHKFLWARQIFVFRGDDRVTVIRSNEDGLLLFSRDFGNAFEAYKHALDLLVTK